MRPIRSPEKRLSILGPVSRSSSKPNYWSKRSICRLSPRARSRPQPAIRTRAAIFIADTASGSAIQFADGSAYSSSGGGGYASPRKPHAEIITDRNLYRPGQVVKMKGMVRKVTDAGLTIPEQSIVNWRVTEGYEDR